MPLKSVSAPRFGGCQDPQNKKITKCALSPDDCALSLNSQYVKSHQIEGGICNTPSQVSTGRCTSSLDGNICTYSADACEMVSMFEPESESNQGFTCNLIQDTTNNNIGPTTKYPHCTFDRTRCVLSKEHCGNDENFYPINNMVWVEPCTCDEVPVGMCYINDVSPITADSSFCAVGSYDCPDSYSFISAPNLLKLNDAPRACNLCRKVDVVEERKQHERVVESGGCYANSKFVKCALQSTDCPSFSTFKSSVEMRQLDHVPCTPEDMAMGECTSNLDEVDCTSDPSACYLPEKFVKSNSCSVHSNLDTSEPSYFGMCRESEPAGGNWRNNRCVWQESECLDIKEIWWYARLPQENWLRGCTCEHVETGGCPYENPYQQGSGQDTSYHCAVSKYGCADPSSYLSSLEMRDLGIHCKLCQPRHDAVVPTANPTTEGHGTIMGNGGKIDGNNSNSPTPSNPSSPTENSNNSNSNNVPSSSSVKFGKNGNVFALAFFFSFLIVSISVAGFLLYRKRVTLKKRQKDLHENRNVPPNSELT